MVNRLGRKKSKKKVCVICGNLVKRVSRKGNCPACSKQMVVDSINQLQAKEGVVYDKWEKNITAGIIKARKQKK